MQFFYHQNAGDCALSLSGEDFTYLIKARRAKLQSHLPLRNLRDGTLYTYALTAIEKKSAQLTLVESLAESAPDSSSTHSSGITSAPDSTAGLESKRALHLLWAVIEPKMIEKTLPMLNELGVARISFFYSAFSQGQFVPNLERLQKILIASCQQCGRTNLMELEVLRDFQALRARYKHFYAFDFNGQDIIKHNPFKAPESTQDFADSHLVRIMVGAEGGFSQEERAQFERVVTLKDSHILRSESACVFLASLAKAQH